MGWSAYKHGISKYTDVDLTGNSAQKINTNFERIADLFDMEPVNARRMGAVGDGTADDSVALAAAAVAAKVLGRALYVPAGRYKTVPLDVTDLEIYGDGWSSVLLSLAGGHILIGTEGDGAIVRNLWLKGILDDYDTGAGTGNGLYINDTGSQSFNLAVQNLRITNCGGSGVRLNNCFSLKLDNVNVSDCKDHAFNITADSSNSMPCVTLINCYAALVAGNKFGYYFDCGRPHLIGCNGVNFDNSRGGLGIGSSWIFSNAGARLTGCNMESFSTYGARSTTDQARWTFADCTFLCIGAADFPAGCSAISVVGPNSTVTLLGQNTFIGSNWKNGLPIHVTKARLLQFGDNGVYQTYDDADSLTYPACTINTSVLFFLTPAWYVNRLAASDGLMVHDGIFGHAPKFNADANGNMSWQGFAQPGTLNVAALLALDTTGFPSGITYWASDGVDIGETTGNGKGCTAVFKAAIGWLRQSDNSALTA